MAEDIVIAVLRRTAERRTTGAGNGDGLVVVVIVDAVRSRWPSATVGSSESAGGGNEKSDDGGLYYGC